MRRIAAVVLAGLTLVATGCEALIIQRVDEARTGAGLTKLPQSRFLQDVARAIVNGHCGHGEIDPVDPMQIYTAEPAVAVVHLEERALLDPELEGDADVTATEEIWAHWQDEPAITDPRWDDMAVVEVPCVQPDGNGGAVMYLYMALVLRDRP